MKRGFALLETIIVITFLTVSLLLIYGTFTSMITNSKKNVLYDNASDIYKVYYVKEYLLKNNIESLLNNNLITEISCSNFPNTGCNKLIKELKINKMYITKKDIKGYDNTLYSSNFNNYLDTLSNKDESSYRLIIELKSGDTYSYASIGINGEENE